MVEIRIKLEDRWCRTDNISVIGVGLDGDCFKVGESLVSYFEQVDSWSEFFEKIQALNGFFAVVVHRGDEYYIAVDRVRSIPLFYAIKEDEFILSDDPQWIETNVGKNYDLASVAEFLLTGYVTGNYTFNRGIRQLQAGEALRVCKKNNLPSIHSMQYYEFITGKGEKDNAPETDLLRRLDEVTLAAIERLVKIARGRTIVIPLSGGLDSRLIVMTLKRLGYKNVLAFSYGVKGNWESRISQEVARQLGIPWYFVEYSRDLWKQWYWSNECQSYIKYASKLVSLAHLQDWPAIMELKTKGMLSGEAVIVPGHTGDFVSGGHIPAELISSTRCDVQKVIQAIWRHHYVLMPSALAAEYVGLNEQEVLRSVRGRLEAYFEQNEVLTVADAIGLYESWDWAERQAKYIVNSVRVYDFFGLDWWMPWWDQEVMLFWEHVPLQLRIDRRLYKKYVNYIQEKLRMETTVPLSAYREKLKSILKKLDKAGLLRKVYAMVKKKSHSPASVILALNGAFNLESEREISVLGVAAIIQLALIKCESSDYKKSFPGRGFTGLP
ncbi:asparagine synthase-related protein [Candidatus Caldatribacterium saccharofermentans]|uniref:asparagine synthase-related protein n=1 Tax=Candidatus Caldatribacterium saccharofermentans TaxID=1454753 RepID=UPI003D087773